MEELEFPQHCIKQLQDRSQEKRLHGAQHVEEIVRQIVRKKQNTQQIKKFIDHFNKIFLQDNTNNQSMKKGGLLVISHIAVAISSDTHLSKQYVTDITDCILSQLGSQTDNKIKFCALESLFKVCQALGTIVIINFCKIFEKLITIYAIFDEDIRKAMNSLDSYLMGLVNDSFQDNKNYFKLPDFINILSQKIKTSNPQIQKMVISWINGLSSIPNLNLLSYLPNFLEDLFIMLCLTEKEMQNAVKQCTEEFLSEIIENQRNEWLMLKDDENDDYGRNYQTYNDGKESQTSMKSNSPNKNFKNITFHTQILDILIKLVTKKQNNSSDTFVKFMAMKWIMQYVELYYEGIETCIKNQQNQMYSQGNLNYNDQQNSMEKSRINPFVTYNNQNEQEQIQDKKIAKQSVIKISGQFFKAFELKVSKIIEIVLINLSNDEEDFRRVANTINETLLKIVAQLKYTNIQIESVMAVLKIMLNNNRKGDTMENSLHWMKCLLKTNNNNMLPEIDDILSKLMEKLSTFEGELVQNVIDVLGNISLNEQYFEKVIEKLLDVCHNNKDFRAKQSDITVKKLCQTLNSRKVFQIFANKLQNYNDMDFVATLVQSLDNILLSDPQLSDLRELLRFMKYDSNKKEKSQQLFEKLFGTWCYNPVSTITLCFLGQQYELAYYIIMSFVEIQFDSDILLQLGKLVCYIEMQQFVYLRLQLLEHHKYPYLLKCLQGLLMLLPQGKAFQILKERLQCVSYDNSVVSSSIVEDKKIVNNLDIKSLLDQFKNRQKIILNIKNNLERKQSKSSQNGINLI